jgi:hypothetical protein
MHQRRAVGATLPFGSLEPQHGLALALGDRFTALPAIVIFPGRIDRVRPAPGFLPIALERTPGLVLRFVDLAVGMEASERIVADRKQATIFSSGSSASGFSTSTIATSALRNRSRDLRSYALA